jgi:hypothetical protein
VIDAVAGGAPSTGDLWRWVDRLTRSRRERVARSILGGPRWVEHHEVPSLLEQLVEQQATTSSGRSGGGGGIVSRAPLDLATTALLAEIEDLVVEGLIAHDVAPHRTVEQVGRVTVHLLDVPASLRALAAVVVGTGDEDLVDWWADRYCAWVLRAEECLDLEAESTTTRPVRGARCPACRVDHVLVDRDGETFREAALTITFRDGQVLHVNCRHCSTSQWRGDGVDALADSFSADLDVELEHLVDVDVESAAAIVPGPRAAGDDLVTA